MFGIVIDELGYKVEFIALNGNKTPQFYELQDGESIVEKDWQIANTLLKAKWTGTEWVEGATEEEIQAWRDSQPKDVLQETIDERVISLEKQLADLEISQIL